MKKLLLLVVATLGIAFANNALYAQTKRKTPLSFKKIEVPKYEINLHFTQAITQLHSSSFGNEETNKQGSIGGVDFSYNFRKFTRTNMAVSFGFNYSTYKTERNAVYNDSVVTTDFTNDYVILYEKAVVHETQKISFVNIPVLFHFNYLLGAKTSVFLTLGPELALPVKKSYASTGPYTRTGYYPQYNAPIADKNDSSLIYYPTNLPIAYNGTLKVGTGLSLLSGIGFKYRINYRLSAFGGLNLAYGILNINKSSGSQPFLISPSFNNFNSLMGRGDKISTIAYGLQLGFSFNITKKPVAKEKPGAKSTDKTMKK